VFKLSIRRNRRTANESQRRKREALEQIGPLRKKYEKVVKRLKILEEENKLMKQLLIDVSAEPEVKKKKLGIWSERPFENY
jgi:hypothetical protein